MKPPLRTDPITITARAEHGSGYDYIARAQVEGFAGAGATRNLGHSQYRAELSEEGRKMEAEI